MSEYRATEFRSLLHAFNRLRTDFPTLWRWYLGNRLRRVTVGIEQGVSRGGYSAPPRSITLRPTFLCNARCQMCSYANSVDPDTLQAVTANAEMLELDLACRLVDSLAPYHPMISISGGEPLLWGDQLYGFLMYCRQRHVSTTVTSNGTLLLRSLDRLMASPPDVLVLSVHGLEETHNRIVGLQAFQRIDEALRLLLKLKNGEPFAPPLVVTNTVMMSNAQDLETVVRFGHRRGVVLANFQPLWTTTAEMHLAQRATVPAYDGRLTAGHNVDTQAVAPERIWQEMRRVREEGRAVGLPVNFYPNLRERDLEAYYHCPEQPILRNRARCSHLIGQILPDGTVTPCLGHAVGNLHDEDFMTIWNGARMRAFRRKLTQERLFPICTRCCLLWRNE